MFYWPLMSAEIKDYVSSCSVCNTLQPLQCHEPLKSHDIPDRPWSKVATDLFKFNRDNYIVIVDYYSNFLEIDCLRSTSSNAVIQSLKRLLQGMVFQILWCLITGLIMLLMNSVSSYQHGNSTTLPLHHIIHR